MARLKKPQVLVKPSTGKIEKSKDDRKKKSEQPVKEAKGKEAGKKKDQPDSFISAIFADAKRRLPPPKKGKNPGPAVTMPPPASSARVQPGMVARTAVAASISRPAAAAAASSRPAVAAATVGFRPAAAAKSLPAASAATAAAPSMSQDSFTAAVVAKAAELCSPQEKNWAERNREFEERERTEEQKRAVINGRLATMKREIKQEMVEDSYEDTIEQEAAAAAAASAEAERLRKEEEERAAAAAAEKELAAARERAAEAEKARKKKEREEEMERKKKEREAAAAKKRECAAERKRLKEAAAAAAAESAKKKKHYIDSDSDEEVQVVGDHDVQIVEAAAAAASAATPKSAAPNGRKKGDSRKKEPAAAAAAAAADSDVQEIPAAAAVPAARNGSKGKTIVKSGEKEAAAAENSSDKGSSAQMLVIDEEMEIVEPAAAVDRQGPADISSPGRGYMDVSLRSNELEEPRGAAAATEARPAFFATDAADAALEIVPTGVQPAAPVAVAAAAPQSRPAPTKKTNARKNGEIFLERAVDSNESQVQRSTTDVVAADCQSAVNSRELPPYPPRFPGSFGVVTTMDPRLAAFEHDRTVYLHEVDKRYHSLDALERYFKSEFSGCLEVTIRTAGESEKAIGAVRFRSPLDKRNCLDKAEGCIRVNRSSLFLSGTQERNKSRRNGTRMITDGRCKRKEEEERKKKRKEREEEERRRKKEEQSKDKRISQQKSDREQRAERRRKSGGRDRMESTSSVESEARHRSRSRSVSSERPRAYRKRNKDGEKEREGRKRRASSPISPRLSLMEQHFPDRTPLVRQLQQQQQPSELQLFMQQAKPPELHVDDVQQLLGPLQQQQPQSAHFSGRNVSRLRNRIIQDRGEYQLQHGVNPFPSPSVSPQIMDHETQGLPPISTVLPAPGNIAQAWEIAAAHAGPAWQYQ